MKPYIVQVTPYYPPHLGGLERCVQEISENLVKKDNQVEVFTSDINIKKNEVIKIKNLRVNYSKCFEIFHTPIIPSLLIKLLRIPKDSVIHLHVAQAFVPEIVWLASRVKKIPYIVHFHGDVVSSGKMGFLLPLYKKVFLRKILNDASKIIVPSKDYIDLINRKYSVSETKICSIPNGVNLNNFCYFKKEQSPIINLLFVGRLSVEKNIPLLIRSFKVALKRGCKNVTLHIVGDGAETDKVISLIDTERLKNNIVFHGELRGENLYRMYRNSDIFILPSNKESFGIVLIEAMASGLSIIASDIPGIRNVVKDGETGLLVKPTVENFAEAIVKMADNYQLRKQFSNNGLKEVKKYDWYKIVGQFEDVYREVLNENN